MKLASIGIAILLLAGCADSDMCFRRHSIEDRIAERWDYFFQKDGSRCGSVYKNSGESAWTAYEWSSVYPYGTKNFDTAQDAMRWVEGYCHVAETKPEGVK